MKIGDLVELSAAGQKLKWLSCYGGKLGIVMHKECRFGNIYLLFLRPNGSQMKRVLPRNCFRYAKVSK